MPRNPNTTALQLDPRARKALDERAESYRGQDNLSAPANEIISRYLALVESGTRQLVRREGFSEAHFSAAMDTLNSTWITADSLPYVGGEIAEAIAEDGMGEKWQLPEGSVSLFESLSALECLALADLKERYWRQVTRLGEEALRPGAFWQALDKPPLVV